MLRSRLITQKSPHMPSDSPRLRNTLLGLLPGLIILDIPRASGQRVVYFCRIDPKEDSIPESLGWGDFVLKVSEGIDATEVAYLQKEIEILNSLNSPYYPKLYWNEIFTETADDEPLPARLFVTVEERITARPLSALMQDYSSPEKARRLIAQIACGLQLLWLHPQRIIHRDLKPDNILIRDNGEIAIIDLGIIREEGAVGVTGSSFPHGPCTPLYASPEQTRNERKNITFKSDFFSLGVLAYELVAGEHPFAARTVGGVFEKVQNYNPPTLAEKYGCDEGFSEIVRKMMEKEPYKRYRTVQQLLQALQS